MRVLLVLLGLAVFFWWACWVGAPVAESGRLPGGVDAIIQWLVVLIVPPLLGAALVVVGVAAWKEERRK